MLLGILATNELIVLFVFAIILAIPAYLIYKYGKNKGRFQEMERQMKEKGKDQ